MGTTLEYTEGLVNSSKDHQEWLTRGCDLARQSTDFQFAIGDWLTEGEQRWTRKIYDEAADIFTGYEKKSLYIFAHVARSVKIFIRIKDLSWNHHFAVARFAGNQEKQRELLQHALEHKLSLRDFKDHINKTCSPTVNSESAIVTPDAGTEMAAGKWEDHWGGMPEFEQPELPPFKTIHVHFDNQESLDKFAELIGQKITSETRYIWYPQQERQSYANRCYVDADSEGTPEVAG